MPGFSKFSVSLALEKRYIICFPSPTRTSELNDLEVITQRKTKEQAFKSSSQFHLTASIEGRGSGKCFLLSKTSLLPHFTHLI